MLNVDRPRAIIDRRRLAGELEEQVAWTGYDSAKRGLYVQIFKAALYRGVGEVRRRFEEERIDGSQVVRADAYLVDQIIRQIYEFGVRHVYPEARPSPAHEMSVVATGGYGRAELSPFSDIDILFILPPENTPDQERLVEFCLYMLWDLGLKVGHATRTVDECLRQARKDLTIRTCMLESRWLWGSRPLHTEFEGRFFREVVAGSERSFVEQKLAERDARHERMGDSRYVLEPHIKEGKGGLRDLQTLFWIAKYLYQVKEMDDLVTRGVFNAGDARHFRQTLRFLWTVRCHLHYVTGRPEERLTFDVQEAIARRLNYRDDGGLRGVERFMKHYFLITKTVGDLTRVLCAVLEEDHKKVRKLFKLPSISRLRRRSNGFRLDGDRLTMSAEDTFEKDPVNMLRLFHEAQRHGLDVHPRALRKVHQSLRRIDGTVRADPEANRVFVEMLTSPNDPETTLRRLNEAGVFGRFITEFGRVVAQMQYDMYHVHTVDEHTIRCIGILHQVETGQEKSRHPTATEVIREIQARRALYMAVLLHDIGKGRGGDHSDIGADIALTLCPRLGLGEWETMTVSWLVRWHLLMSRTAFKRDIDDAKTVSDFVQVVQSPERLRMLLVLTNVDVDAVGPGIWNTWKENLLSELYYRALEEMEMAGGQPAQRRAVRVEVAKDRLRERLADWDPEELERLIARGYSDYWLAFDAETQAFHFALMRAMESEGADMVVQARERPERGATELIVYAPDHPGLFGRLAGAMALTGASIVDAKAVTLANGMALDTFHVQDGHGDPFAEPQRLERLQKRIEAAVYGNIRPSRELEISAARALPSRTDVFTVPPKVIIDNRASRTHTVIEVNGRDRKGFLHDVASTLTGLGLQISSAHISTYGERVVDVFYVKDIFGLKIEDGAKVRRIEARLREAVAAPEPPPAVQQPSAETGRVAAE